MDMCFRTCTPNLPNSRIRTTKWPAEPKPSPHRGALGCSLVLRAVPTEAERSGRRDWVIWEAGQDLRGKGILLICWEKIHYTFHFLLTLLRRMYTFLSLAFQSQTSEHAICESMPPNDTRPPTFANRASQLHALPVPTPK